MPKSPDYILIWSTESHSYELSTPDHPLMQIVSGTEEAWFSWLKAHTSFSFRGQYGRLTLLKESRPRGAGYWYAYHTGAGRAQKRYLGRAENMTFTRLEEVARALQLSPTSAPLVPLHLPEAAGAARQPGAAREAEWTGDSSTFARTFAGIHRYLLDYIQQEILQRLSLPLQHFLLQTAVLSRMNADLCQAVTGEPSSQQLLEELERARLFLVPLDEHRQWYRWHDLFRETLLAHARATQSPEQIRRWQLRAACWHERQGSTREAIDYALAAADYVRAAALIEHAQQHMGTPGEAPPLHTRLMALPEAGLKVHEPRVFSQEGQTPVKDEAAAEKMIPALSPQEQRVLRLLVDGQTYAEIAQTQIVSLNTIKSQVSSIYRKLNVSHRAAASALARRLPLL